MLAGRGCSRLVSKASVFGFRTSSRGEREAAAGQPRRSLSREIRQRIFYFFNSAAKARYLQRPDKSAISEIKRVWPWCLHRMADCSALYGFIIPRIYFCTITHFGSMHYSRFPLAVALLPFLFMEGSSAESLGNTLIEILMITFVIRLLGSRYSGLISLPSSQSSFSYQPILLSQREG